MQANPLNYGHMVEMALRDVVRTALMHVEEHGLPGHNHFYISFLSQHPDVDIPDYLKQRFPHEMTIVLQHQFWNLEVKSEGFSVELSFNQSPERLYVPFAALTSFADPAAQFRLEFHTLEEGVELDEQEADKEAGDPNDAGASDDQPRKTAEIVTLDSFRKK